MPLKRRKQSVPHSAYAWSTTSVSHVVWKACPATSNSVAELAKVVDLTVVDDLQPAVIHRHRLAAVLEVDDAEAAEPERCDGVLEVPVIVRTAMPERLGHRLEQRPVGWPPEARYPAHVSASAASVVVGA